MYGELSKKELEEVAEQLGITVEHAAQLYQKATGMKVAEKSLGDFFHALKRKQLNDTLDKTQKELDELEVTLKGLRSNDEVDRIIDRMLSDNQQSAIVQTLKSIEQKLTPDYFQKASQRQAYNAFTSQRLNDEVDAQVRLKEHRPKQVMNVYDAFTSGDLNPGLQVATKEAEQADRNFFNAFTSKELNEPAQDNRPKTGNPHYDAFTSRNLNQ